MFRHASIARHTHCMKKGDDGQHGLPRLSYFPAKNSLFSSNSQFLTNVFFSTFLIVYTFFSCQCQGDEKSLREQVDKDLPAAMARLEAFYSQMSGSGTISVYRYPRIADERSKSSMPGKGQPSVQEKYDTNQPKTMQSQARLSFSVSSPYQKCENQVLLQGSYDDNKRSFVFENPADGNFGHTLTCVGPSYSFSLEWTKGQNTPIVRSLEKGADRRLERELASRLRLLRAPFSYGDDLLRLVMKESDFHIVAVSQTADRTRKLVKIDYEYNARGYQARRSQDSGSPKEVKPPPRHIGSIVVCPDDSWAIQKLTYATGPIRRNSTEAPGTRGYVEIEYGDRREGIPLPRQITQYMGRFERYDVLDIEQIRVGPTEAGEFKLAAYGLPEIESAPVARPHSQRGPSIWFGIAAVSIVLALVFGVLNKKYARPAK